jgi:hypothetical protein
MPTEPTANHDDLSGRLEVRLDQSPPPGDVLPALARLLRKIRDREKTEAAQPPTNDQPLAG